MSLYKDSIRASAFVLHCYCHLYIFSAIQLPPWPSKYSLYSTTNHEIIACLKYRRSHDLILLIHLATFATLGSRFAIVDHLRKLPVLRRESRGKAVTHKTLDHAIVLPNALYDSRQHVQILCSLQKAHDTTNDISTLDPDSCETTEDLVLSQITIPHAGNQNSY